MPVPSVSELNADHTRVPGGLVYKHPSKDEFPTQAGHWAKALETILQCCEREEDSTNNPIVFFGNEKVSVLDHERLSCNCSKSSALTRMTVRRRL